MDLMNAALDDPIESFKLFRTALDRAGASIGDMSPAKLRVLADAMKMDVSEVKKLMSMDFSRSIQEMKNMSDEQENLSNMAAKATPVLKKLQLIFYQFGVLIAPAVDLVREFC